MPRYSIDHKTVYTYNQAVLLKPHFLRLRPRCDAWQKLVGFNLSVTPEPTGRSEYIDLDGNSLMQLWFTEATESLQLHVTTEVETCQENPFNYLLEPWAIELAYDYPHSLKTLLDSYLRPNVHLDPTAFQLAQEIHYKTEGNTIAFLATLNQLIYENCQYIVRETGEPWFAGVTWNSKQGSCRDFVVLFMEVCRAIGLAARFVSGYQEGDREQEKRDLHAWVEVYLPGAGWRGYDPTLGLAVADRHIAVAASSIPNYTAPISGHVVPVQPTFATGREAISKMETHIFIDY